MMRTPANLACIPRHAKPSCPAPVPTPCTLHARSERRGLELAAFPSRALLKNEIHELILTAEDAGPGKTVNPLRQALITATHFR